MITKYLQLLAVLICLVAFVGCEGDQGPVGPAGTVGADGTDGTDGADGIDGAEGPMGPPGPSAVLCIAEIDGDPDPGVVVSSWPSGVSIQVADASEGIWNITLTGSFPAAEGSVMVSISDTDAGVSNTANVTSWSTSQISLTVGAWQTLLETFTDCDFTFMVLATE